MIKVIIVDDEPLIRDGLIQLIDWKEFQMEIKATFQNGLHALKYLAKEEADLIIVDMKMPVMNGIHFMQECRKRNYSCCFIVLSGYSDFEYVKRAAQLGIENYLLKPVDEYELSQTLTQVGRKIDAQRKQEDLKEEGIRILRNNLMYRLLLGEITYDELWERKDYLNISLEEKGYQVAVIKFVPKNPTDILPVNYKQLLHSVLQFIDTKSIATPVTDFSSRMLYLLYSGKHTKQIQTDLENILSYINVTSLFYAYASVGLSVDWIETLHDSYISAFSLINTAGYNSHTSIRWAKEKGGDDAFLLPHIEYDQLLLLNEKLVYKNKAEIQRIVDHIFFTNQFIPLNGLQILAFMIVSKVYSYMKAYGTAPDVDMNSIEKQLDEAYSFSDQDSLRVWVYQIIDELFLLEENSNPSGTVNMKKILKYLHKNYNKGINLKSISETFHINTLYLGRILKLETGCSFTDYINHIRLEEAGRLLLNTDFSAKQISEMVGYNNDKYFNTQFKKYMGITPREYRIKHQKETKHEHTNSRFPHQPE